MRYTFLFITILITSCHQKPDDLDCEDLSMKYYRGLPKESSLFVKYCKDQAQDLKYSPEKCKNALGTLMMTGSLSHVEKKFGKRIKGCFNLADIEKFAR